MGSLRFEFAKYREPDDPNSVDDPVPEKPGEDAYARLPRTLQLTYSRQEYLWLSDNEKATLVQRECEPDVFVD